MSRIINVVISTIERKGNLEVGYRFIAATAIINIYIKISIGIRI